MGLLAMIPKLVEKLYGLFYLLLIGSARLFMGLLAMIPKLVERVLLHVLSSIKWVCQIVHGSASHDPQVSSGGSARLSMGLLAMIPKLVEVGLPDCPWVCQP